MELSSRNKASHRPVHLPLRRGSRRLGVLSLGRSYPNAYDEEEVHFLCLAADQIGLAIDAAVNFFISSACRIS